MVWGSGGGAAHFLPEGSGSVVVRASLIAVDQMADLVLQENGLDPKVHAEDASALARSLARLSSPGRLDVSAYVRQGGYDVLHCLDALSLDGRTLRVFLLGSSSLLPWNDPPSEYLAVMRAGLVDSCMLSEAAADAYLSRCLEGLDERRG